MKLQALQEPRSREFKMTNLELRESGGGFYRSVDGPYFARDASYEGHGARQAGEFFATDNTDGHRWTRNSKIQGK